MSEAEAQPAACLEEEKGRASASVLWRHLLPCRALAAVLSTAPCRPLADHHQVLPGDAVFESIADDLCVVSLSQSKVFSTKQCGVRWGLRG